MSYSKLFAAIGTLVLLLVASFAFAEVPGTMNYQGRLTDTGNPVTDTVSIIFTIYDDSTGGNSKWTETHPSVSVIDGLFNVVLGEGTPATPIEDTVFTGADRWLGIKIGEDSEIAPRTHLVSVPYSQTVGTIHDAKGGRIEGSVEITGVLSVGPDHVLGGSHVFTAGEFNQVNGDYSTIPGGLSNQATGDYSVISGGTINQAIGNGAAISGGIQNYAGGGQSNIGGGSENFADGDYSNVGGGYFNEASGAYSSIPGGTRNTAAGAYSLAAGFRAQANHEGSFVWGDHTDAAFSSTAANQFLIRAGNGVGINTDSSVGGLTVNGPTRIYPGAVDPWGHANRGLVLGKEAADDYGRSDADSASIFFPAHTDDYCMIYSRTKDAKTDLIMRVMDDADDNLLLLPSGNVGIKTSNPAYALQVEGNIDADSYTINGVPIGSGGSYWTQSGSDIYYNAGNVGIGTSTPGDKLDVNGNMAVTGDITAGMTSDTSRIYGGGAEFSSYSAKANRVSTVNLGTGSDSAFVDFMYVSPGNDTASVGLNVNVTGSRILAMDISDLTRDSSVIRADGVKMFHSDDGGTTYDAVRLAHTGLAFIPESYGDLDSIVVGPEGIMAVGGQTDRDSSVIRADGIRMFHSNDGGTTYDTATFASTGLEFLVSDAVYHYGDDGISFVNASDDTLMKVNLADITIQSPTSNAAFNADTSGIVMTSSISDADRTAINGHGMDVIVNDNSKLQLTANSNGGSIVAFNTTDVDRTAIDGHGMDVTVNNNSKLQLTADSNGGSIVAFNTVDVDRTEIDGHGIAIIENDTTRVSLGTNTLTFIGTDDSVAYGPPDFVFRSWNNGHITMDASNSSSGGMLNIRNNMGTTGISLDGATGVLGCNTISIPDFQISQSGILWDSSGTTAFEITADGGTNIYSNHAQTTGVTLAAGGGSWSSVSDRNKKENFTTINSAEVLAKLASLPMSTWNYKTQSQTIRHIGPMAQDFYDAFGVGEDNKHITTIDADGVALAAIQALLQRINELETRIAELEKK